MENDDDLFEFLSQISTKIMIFGQNSAAILWLKFSLWYNSNTQDSFDYMYQHKVPTRDLRV